MEITKQTDGRTLTISIAGRLDTTTSPELETEIKSCLDDVENLVFDLKDLEYISSAGLRVILKCQKTMNLKGTMKLINVNESVMDVFDITGFLDILTIE